MPEVVVNGRVVEVPAGASVAAAVLIAGASFRRSVTGAARGPVCGMGTCFECRATVDGRTQQRTCQMPCVDGMVVTTGASDE